MSPTPVKQKRDSNNKRMNRPRNECAATENNTSGLSRSASVQPICVNLWALFDCTHKLAQSFRLQQKPSTPLHDKTDFFTLNSACSLNMSAIWQEARTVPVLSCLSRCCLSLRCRAGTSLRTSSLRVTTAFVVQEPQKRCFEVKRMISTGVAICVKECCPSWQCGKILTESMFFF